MDRVPAQMKDLAMQRGLGMSVIVYRILLADNVKMVSKIVLVIGGNLLRLCIV